MSEKPDTPYFAVQPCQVLNTKLLSCTLTTNFTAWEDVNAHSSPKFTFELVQLGSVVTVTSMKRSHQFFTFHHDKQVTPPAPVSGHRRRLKANSNKEQLVFIRSKDAQVGSLVVNLNATDPDRPDDLHPVTYTLVGIIALSATQPTSPTNTSHFRLEGHTGRLLLAEPLDRETHVEYQLTVRATDRGSPKTLSCDLALRIQVLDVNDNAPVFGSPSGYRFVIEEEKEAGSVVGVVSATDADEGKNGKISYRLFGTAAAVQRGFAVNPTTGEITTKVSLDREVNAVYEFFVTAEDSSSSKRLTATTKVIVELLDINVKHGVLSGRVSECVLEENLSRTQPLDAREGVKWGEVETGLICCN
ncbi:Protein dachsou [Taenia crassiceps]|uniref:Protein dachsou n=1 Tax=Taenia crassiceps TaxID=6207 RepID=A0ABR4Q1S7_9CEST